MNLKDGSEKDNDVDLKAIYDSRVDFKDEDNGMTFKDALHFMRHEGVKTDKGLFKIKEYSMVGSIETLKAAIVMNGPCCGALPVYSNDNEFWKKKYGDKMLGGHAISIIGYDEGGFFIRNSWGSSFGDDGYTYIKNEDMDIMMEMWTIID